MVGFEYRDANFNGRVVSVPQPPSSVYKKLQKSKNEFRLLYIDAEDPSDPTINCAMLPDSLDKPPTYLALSYQWGDPSQCETILVNNQAFPVTSNLYNALCQLRKYCANRAIWIDAICLHQRDLQEKADQLPRFKDIYTKAECVIIYLGLAADGSDQVMEFMQQQFESVSRLRETLNLDQAKYNELEVPLHRLCAREYWRRAWVSQEIALSRSVRIACGDRYVHGKALILLLEDLQRLGKMDNFHEYFKHLGHLREQRDGRVDNVATGLLQVLHDCAGALATDERDKVYAMTGLAYDANDFIQKPDYKDSMTPTRLCREMTDNAIFSKRSLDIIFHGSKSDSNHLPSWCPNYLKPGQRTVDRKLSRYLSGQDLRYRLGVSGHRWKTQRESLVRRDNVKIQDDELQAEGVKFGSIQSLASKLYATPSKDSRTISPHCSLDRIRRRISAALSMYANIKPNEGSASFALYYLFHFEKNEDLMSTLTEAEDIKLNILRQWRAVNANFEVDGYTLEECAANISGAAFHDIVSRQSSVRSTISISSDDSGSSRRPGLPTLDLKAILLAIADLFEEEMTFMVTDRLRVGWAHPDARQGDTIYLLHGCTMPAILRPTVRGFKVVGHCYVEGLMDGNAWLKLIDRNYSLSKVTMY